MKFLLALLLSFFFLVLIFFWTRLHIYIHIKRDGKHDSLKIKCTCWFGLIRLEWQIPFFQLNQDLSGIHYELNVQGKQGRLQETKKKFTLQDIFHFWQTMQEWLVRVHYLKLIFKRFLKQIHVDELQWISKIGSGDASETGVLTGVVWGVKASLLSLVTSYVSLHTRPLIQVTPFFQEKKLESEFKGMFRLQIGKAIIAGTHIALNIKKRGDNPWQNTQYKA